MVRGKGVRFFTNNLEISGLLRNLVVNICGYDHIIHAPSLVGQFYWVQLHRVPTAITPLDVFDFFEYRGCSPVSVFPTISAGTLHSNSLKVVFNSKQVPGFLWSQRKEDEPLREIFLAADQPPTFVVHKISALNEFVPPSLKGKRRKFPERPTKATTPPLQQQVPTMSPALPAMAQSLPTSNDPPSIWHKKNKVRLFPVPTEDIQLEEIQVTTMADSANASRHWAVPLANRYELLTLDGNQGMPDYDVKFCKSTLEDLQYGDDFLEAVQAQPSFFRLALEDPCLADFWMQHATQHALYRLLGQARPEVFQVAAKFLPIAQVLEDCCCMFEDAAGDTLSPAAALERLCKQETPQYSAQDHIQLALWDLYAMVAAPSVYFDPVKLAAVLHVEELVSIDSTRLLLWSDDTLSDWVYSDLGQAMISSATTGPFAAAFAAMNKSSICASP
ncbi:hypothetical protein DYB32_008322 [Aphanomyces invadans]|uniref:Uncharacterized protein n=1 Tax=Aphanomyces invadans TaxID=157072 RepID=A0A3R6WH07_9STRA|nr:hypothetical protein DYB32_008322 [Aphanomyces invadans]